jgi:hypothetical protein
VIVSREVAATTPPSRPPRSWNGEGEVLGVVPLLRADGSEETFYQHGFLTTVRKPWQIRNGFRNEVRSNARIQPLEIMADEPVKVGLETGDGEDGNGSWLAEGAENLHARADAPRAAPRHTCAGATAAAPMPTLTSQC